MAPVTVHLVVPKEANIFIKAVSQLKKDDRPIYVGKAHHWVVQPEVISNAALLGAGKRTIKWEYVIVNKIFGADELALPNGLGGHVQHRWSIAAATLPDGMLESYDEANEKQIATKAPLPQGWNADDHSALDASEPPTDLVDSLALKSFTLGADRGSEQPVVLKDFIRTFGKSYSGPIQMLNLDSCNPGQRSRLYDYIVAFGSSVGVKYGGAGVPMQNVTAWTSRSDEGEKTIAEAEKSEKGYGKEGGEVVGWEDTALVWYPSIWHFGKLLDDEEYAAADRKYKQGVLRDGPILCCTQIHVKYE
jgi:hypothetical protein